jgi:hypothetical protein
MFWVPRKYFPKKEKNCNNLDMIREIQRKIHTMTLEMQL